jgi:hypothetical protein
MVVLFRLRGIWACLCISCSNLLASMSSSFYRKLSPPPLISLRKLLLSIISDSSGWKSFWPVYWLSMSKSRDFSSSNMKYSLMPTF